MNFTPLEINLKLKHKELRISHNPFDSVLARLYFDKLKSEKAFDGDYSQKLPFLKYDERGFYHASNPFYEIKALDNHFLTKQFDIKLYEKWGKGADKTDKRNALSGRFKSWLEVYEVESVESVKYFVNGDKDYIFELLKNLRYLGKKPALGLGKIESFEIRELEEDFSLVIDNRAARYLPCDDFKHLDDKLITKKRLIHPYWFKSDKQNCIIPSRRTL